MPAKMNKKPPKKTAAQKAAAQRAKNVTKATKLVAKGRKIGEKSKGKQYSPKRKTQVKGMAQATTADNMVKAGTKLIKAGGQGSLPKRRSMRVTPKSIVRTDTKRSKDLQRHKRGPGNTRLAKRK
jgi:hypothetical protein